MDGLNKTLPNAAKQSDINGWLEFWQKLASSVCYMCSVHPNRGLHYKQHIMLGR